MSQQSANSGDLQGQMEDCIQDCLNCHTVCLDTAMRVLQQRPQQNELIRVLLDCSEICATSAHFMLRNSSLHSAVCQVCAEVCTHAGESCEQSGEKDAANACRACANACQQMIKMVV